MLTRRRLLRRSAALLSTVPLLPTALPAAGRSGGIAELAADHGFGPGEVGALLYEPFTGEPLEALEADRPFAPASVAKLATAAAALAVLGPDHVFRTALAGTALAGGILGGDLALVGGGNPALATEDLIGLVQAIRQRGVTRVGGRLLADAGALPAIPEIDPSQPYVAGYNPAVGALSLNYNRAELVWRRRPDGGVETGLWSVSDAGRHPLDEAVIEVAVSGPVAIARLPGGTGERWRIVPGNGLPERLFLPLRDPARAAAGVLRRLAAAQGLALPPIRSAATPAGAVPLAEHVSAPLATLLAGVLRWSNNLAAELIGLATARRLDGQVATLDRSAAAIARWLRGAAPDTDWSTLSLRNHSGLSSASRMSARQIAAVLRVGGPPLWGLLHGGGEDGSVLAKSGTMAYASGLAGLLPDAGGRPLGFVILVGDEARRRAFDRSLDRSTVAIPAEARAWLARARAFQAACLAAWGSRPG